jgi:hypothetical protein
MMERQKEAQEEIARAESESAEALRGLDAAIADTRQQISDTQIHLAHQHDISRASPERRAELAQGHLVLTEAPAGARGRGSRGSGGGRGRGGRTR